MSETAPQYRPEAEEATADSYERIQMLASDVIFDQAKKRIISELESDESLVEYARLNNHENELSAKVRESQDVSEQGKYYSEIELIRDQKDMLPQGTGALYERLNSRYRMLEEYNTLIVDADSFEGRAIGKIIKEAPKLQPETEAAAPFSNFKENDEESWQHVPNEAIDDYLDHRIFAALLAIG